MSGKLYVFCQQKGLVKTGIDLYIDGERHHLKPQEEPYLFELAAGNHKLKFKDPAGIAKTVGGGIVSGVGAVGAGVVGLSAGLVSGNVKNVAMGATSGVRGGKGFGKSLSNKVIGKSASLKGEYDLEIQENETVKLLCTKDKKDGIVMGTL